jgi:hypothetical protein
MFFKDVPFDGLFIIVHASQLFQQKPIVESMLDSQHINNCIAASYAFQRSEHRFESMDEGYISFVAALSRRDNEPIRKRMREDELYDALVRPSQQSVVHIQGRLARLPGKQTHLCNCGDATCMKMVSGAHICEICKNGVFAVFCFAVANEHNYDGICKPCFNAGLHSVTISAGPGAETGTNTGSGTGSGADKDAETGINSKINDDIITCLTYNGTCSGDATDT